MTVQARAVRALLRVLLVGSMWVLCLAPAMSDMSLTDLDRLPAADKYRQLNLMLMVSEGIDAAFAAQLLPGSADEAGEQPGTLTLLDVDDFQTPLNRIVDQRAMITQAAHMFRFSLANRESILSTLSELASTEPDQVAQVDLIQLAEDAIIIRSALAGSIEYLAKLGDPAMAANLETYQKRTLYLRNVMEYWKFDRELSAITDDAMADTGGRMQAYQRMLEAEPNLVGFKQHLQAVEEVYRHTTGRKIKPADLETKELIDQESQVHKNN